MDRRNFLTAAATAGAAVLARPALAQQPRVLRFVPEGNLVSPDPVWTTTTVARNHGLMIWDTMYGLDASFTPQPQMVAGHEVSDDRLTWRFTLRDGLAFHDGTPVRAADCVASLRRYSARRPLGQKLRDLTAVMKALDDKRFEIQLTKPYALILATLADNCFVMPEHVAATDPFQQIADFTGSGPFKFIKDQWVSGSQAIYLRNDAYQPRPEPPSFLAGGKVANFDRVEWRIIPDPATSMAALRNNEVDWWQNAAFDLLPVLRSLPGVTVAVNDKVGAIGMLAFNHLNPPFDNPKLLRAVLSAVVQRDFMEAAVSDPALFHLPCGVFTPGLQMANDAGLEVFAKPDIAAARKAVAASGYAGERVVLMVPSDYPVQTAFAQVAAAMLKDIGINVQYDSTDWGTMVARRAGKEPVDKGGWSMFPTTYEGLSVMDPASNSPLRGNGPGGWFGWPTSPRLEGLRDQWFEAPDLAAQQSISAEMQQIAMQEVPFIPLGQLFYPTAYRTALKGIVPAPFPIFWNVQKT